MSAQTLKQANQSIEELLKIAAAQQAQRKQAEEMGGSSHPTATCEDSTQEASEGARSAEHVAQVKQEQGPLSTESKEPGTPPQEAHQQNMNMTSSGTGMDPANETTSAKTTTDDDGYDAPTSHPSRVSTEKQATSGDAASVLASAAQAKTAGENLLALLGGDAPADGQTQKTAEQIEREAGVQLADAIVKTAEHAAEQISDDFLVQKVAAALNETDDVADMVADYLDLSKQAMDDDTADDKEKKDPASKPSEEGGDEDTSESGNGASTATVPDDVAVAELQAGSDMDPVAAGGVDPIAELMNTQLPGQADVPLQTPSPGPDSEVQDEANLDEIGQVLSSLGITPDAMADKVASAIAQRVAPPCGDQTKTAAAKKPGAADEDDANKVAAAKKVLQEYFSRTGS